MTADDVFDLTPELKAAALEELKKYRLGPLYTPPSVEGTFMRPGVIGGANWGGGAFDPESGFLYVEDQPLAGGRSASSRRTARRRTRARRKWTPTSSGTAAAGRSRSSAARRPGGGGLPIAKPPYGELVAHQPEHGRDRLARAVRRHAVHPQSPGAARRRAAAAPRRRRRAGRDRHEGRPGPGRRRATTRSTRSTRRPGQEIWRAELPRRSSGTPMTYRTRSGRQFVVMATGCGEQRGAGGVGREMTPGVVLRKT